MKSRDEHASVPELGKIIRRARRDHELTLDQLSMRSGVSKSMLSQIERGLVNPTFGIVWNLTFALGLDLSEIFSGDEENRRSIITHEPAYSIPERKSADGKCRLRLLSPRRTILPMEWYDLRIEPGGMLVSDPHQRGTYEHLTCLAGVLEARVGEKLIAVPIGDTIRYFADQPHAICNPGTEPAQAILVMALPEQYSGRKAGAAVGQTGD